MLKLMESAPPGLCARELAAYLGCSEPPATKWAKVAGYALVDGRSRSWDEARRASTHWGDWSNVDWQDENIDISRQVGVSRERVRQVRKRLMKDGLISKRRFVKVGSTDELLIREVRRQRLETLKQRQSPSGGLDTLA